MLRVTESNRLEVLRDRLAGELDRRTTDVFAADTIVVPSASMARWLALELARTRDVVMNVRFPLPAAFVWEVLERVLGDRIPMDLFDPAVLAWRVFDELGRLEASARFAALHAYTAGDSERPRWELARRIANVYDQYLVYRPDWIRRWEAGGDPGWQAELWRRLVGGRPEPHRVRRLDALVAALGAEQVARAALPDRVLLFGVPTMAPAYVAVFAALARHVDVHYFVLTPTPEYAGDLASARDLARRSVRGDAGGHRETGNALLAVMGKQGAEFRDLLLDWNPATVGAHVPPDETTLLRLLQSDVYHLRDRGTPAFPATPRADDGSIQVHACHGAMREIEVLHDQLLALFDRHDDLRPSDVVVMMPDVERYAPSIEAIFGTAPAERRIPYTIADRSLRNERPLVEAFLSLLALPASRYDANRLLALLDVDAVRRRFGFGEGEIASVRRWVREAGVRWGVDAAARGALGLPEAPEHTWRFGLDRLLLGYAVGGMGDTTVAGIVPFEDVEGTSARALGPLATFVDACVALRAAFDAPRSIVEWVRELRAVLTRFFEAGTVDEDDELEVGRVLAELETVTSRAGFAGAVSIDVVRAHLEQVLATTVATGRFLAGKVTFCALVPMRSIPFEVVCLLGLDDGRFPRPRRPIGFDLMADDFRPGDRSRRDDDRHLFLEALLSARRVLYLGYTGRDVRDDRRLPPSVLVTELTRYLERGCEVRVLREHPLQPFDARYFTGAAALPSYVEELCVARQGAGTATAATARFVTGDFSAPDTTWRTLDVERLVQFFRNPARFVLRDRLGVRLEPARGEVATREPFVLDPLEGYLVRSEILRLARAGTEAARIGDLLRGRGLLPHGAAGRVALARELARIGGMAARLRAELAGPETREPVDVAVGGFRVHGTLAVAPDGGVVEARATSAKAGDHLGLWIRHLLAASASGRAVRSRWLGTEGSFVLEPVEGPRAVLASLLALYWDALHRPLPFFPRAGFAAANARGDPLQAARTDFDRSDEHGFPGEGLDPYTALLFRGRDPLDGEFLALTTRVWGAILAHRRVAA